MSFKIFLNERSGGHLLRRNGAINKTFGRGLKEEHLCEGISNLCQWFRRCGLKKKLTDNGRRKTERSQKLIFSISLFNFSLSL